MNIHARQTAFIPREKSATGNPLVSILINNFNYGNYVVQCIESALQQSHINTEVIVVDDGSTDNSIAQINELRAAHPSVRLISQKNAGQAAAMNAGFAASNGEFVIFLDSDDLLDSNAVESAVLAFRSDTAYMQFYLRTVDEHGTTVGLHPFCHSVETGEVFRQILSSGSFRFMPTSGNIFRRQSLERVFPIPEKQWRICADTFLVAAAASTGRVETLPLILGSYRIHGRNAWYRPTLEPSRQIQIARNHLQLYLDLFAVAKKASRNGIDDFGSLSLIRRAMVALSVASEGTFSRRESAHYRRKLRQELAKLNVPRLERLWHHLVIMAGSGKSPKRRVKPFFVPTAGGKLIAFLRRFTKSSERWRWLQNAPEPTQIMELTPGSNLEFGRGGSGAGLLWYGFGSSENWLNWATSESAGLIFRVPEHCETLDVDINLVPSGNLRELVPQTIAIEANGRTLAGGKLDSGSVFSCHIDKELIEAGDDRVVRMHFIAENATVQSLVNPKLDLHRISSFAIKSVSVKHAEQPKRAVPFTVPARIQPGHPDSNLVFSSGWEVSQIARQTSLRSTIRFCIPNPVMDRFAILLDFIRPSKDMPGDWSVRLSAEGIGSTEIDLRRCKTAVLLIPRNKLSPLGIVDLAVTSKNFLKIRRQSAGEPGNCIRELRLLEYQLGDVNPIVISNGVHIDFSSQGNGAPYLRSGWHAPDEGGVLTSATRSTLSGLYFEGDREVFVTATVSTLLSAEQIKSQTVSIIVNGVRVAVQQIEGLGQITGIIPRDIIGRDRRVKIDILSSVVGTPSQLGPYADQRALGVCLKTLCLEALEL